MTGTTLGTVELGAVELPACELPAEQPSVPSTTYLERFAATERPFANEVRLVERRLAT